MKELEYRVTAVYMFKMVIQIFNALNNIYKELDDATYCKRIIEREETKDETGKTEYGVIPLTRGQITRKVKESGFNAIIKTIIASNISKKNKYFPYLRKNKRKGFSIISSSRTILFFFNFLKSNKLVLINLHPFF